MGHLCILLFQCNSESTMFSIPYQTGSPICRTVQNRGTVLSSVSVFCFFITFM